MTTVRESVGPTLSTPTQNPECRLHDSSADDAVLYDEFAQMEERLEQFWEREASRDDAIRRVPSLSRFNTPERCAERDCDFLLESIQKLVIEPFSSKMGARGAELSERIFAEHYQGMHAALLEGRRKLTEPSDANRDMWMLGAFDYVRSLVLRCLPEAFAALGIDAKPSAL